jgi:hypothetical protein
MFRGRDRSAGCTDEQYLLSQCVVLHPSIGILLNRSVEDQMSTQYPEFTRHREENWLAAPSGPLGDCLIECDNIG